MANAIHGKHKTDGPSYFNNTTIGEHDKFPDMQTRRQFDPSELMRSRECVRKQHVLAQLVVSTNLHVTVNDQGRTLRVASPGREMRYEETVLQSAVKVEV